MNIRTRHKGLTLIEMLVVVGIIAALVGFGAPAVRALRSSFQNDAAVRSVIEATLATACAQAITQGCDVGVRFQTGFRSNQSPDDPLIAQQYMVLVVHEVVGDDAVRTFRSIVGHKPIPVPEDYGVTDLMTRDGHDVTADNPITTPDEWVDPATFTVVFSKEGKLQRRPAYVQHRSDPALYFVSDVEVGNNKGEPGRDRLYIYERDSLREALTKDTTWQRFIEMVNDEPLFVSPFSGQLLGASDSQ